MKLIDIHIQKGGIDMMKEYVAFAKANEEFKEFLSKKMMESLMALDMSEDDFIMTKKSIALYNSMVDITLKQAEDIQQINEKLDMIMKKMKL